MVGAPILDGSTKLAPGTRLRLALDTGAGPPVDPVMLPMTDGDRVEHLPAEAVGAFLAALRQARTLHMELDPALKDANGKARAGELSLDGARETMA